MSYHCIRVYAECACMFSPTRQAYASVCPFIIIVHVSMSTAVCESTPMPIRHCLHMYANPPLTTLRVSPTHLCARR